MSRLARWCGAALQALLLGVLLAAALLQLLVAVSGGGQLFRYQGF